MYYIYIINDIIQDASILIISALWKISTIVNSIPHCHKISKYQET